MRYLWDCDINDILEAMELARSRGVKAGASYEKEFFEVMAKKGKKPACATELTKDELIQQYIEKDKKILDISINNSGETTYNIIKKKDEESGLNFD